jgi:hypothetical protein
VEQWLPEGRTIHVEQWLPEGRTIHVEQWLPEGRRESPTVWLSARPSKNGTYSRFHLRTLNIHAL